MTSFSVIKNPRIERSTKHKLLDLLFLAASAVLSGAQGCEASEQHKITEYSKVHSNYK